MLMRTQGTYYARTEHGGHRVKADQKGFLVSWPTGEIRYASARQTIIALTNKTPMPLPHHRDPKVSFNRYFRRGRFGEPELALDTLSLFSPELSLETPKITIKGSPELSVVQRTGIDLEKRGGEVRKLFFAGYGRRVVRYGYDPEDVLQDVFTGILVRNQGKCPFDPSKSSFGHYVHMVCGCIVSNYRRRYSRLSRNEQFGVLSVSGDTVQDVSESDLAVVGPVHHAAIEAASAHNLLADLVAGKAVMMGCCPMLARSCFNLMVDGHRKGEIAAITGKAPSRIAKMLRMIRHVAAEWRTRVDL